MRLSQTNKQTTADQYTDNLSDGQYKNRFLRIINFIETVALRTIKQTFSSPKSSNVFYSDFFPQYKLFTVNNNVEQSLTSPVIVKAELRHSRNHQKSVFA